jgi:flagellar FliL protein
MATSDADQTTATTPKKGMLVPILFGVILACFAGGGGYWAAAYGPLSPAPEEHDDMTEVEERPAEPVEFVPLETLIISLGPENGGRHLIFTAHLEVPRSYEDEVAHLSPRILDVLNSYLRVIDLSDLSEASTLGRLRAQMLRRVQVVAGTGRVNDLLVTEFVVN